LISFEAVVEASELGRFHVRLGNGHRLKASADGALPPGLEGRVELSPHPCGGWRFITER